MSITRWDPFRDMLSLREAMNQLLEESYIRPGTTGAAGVRGGAQALALDVNEGADAYTVKASLPGMRPEDIQVTVMGDTLTIRAETSGEQERNTDGYLLKERHSGVVQRSVTLPGPIESDGVEAGYEHGVLTLTLPKSRASMPRRIQVQASSGAGQGGSPTISAGTSGAQGGGTSAQDTTSGDGGARLPSLEEQTPGLDQQQERQTLQDAQAFFSQESGQGSQQQQGGQGGQAQNQGTQGSGASGQS